MSALQDVSTLAFQWDTLLCVVVIQAFISYLIFMTVQVYQQQIIKHIYHHLLLDVNECELFSNCDVSTRCTNTIGSYECQCKNGFQGNGFICKGVSVIEKK